MPSITGGSVTPPMCVGFAVFGVARPRHREYDAMTTKLSTANLMTANLTTAVS